MSSGYIHDMYGTRLNHIWANMRTRCNCKTNKDYPDYGGRGIKVCKEWDEFINFHEWAMKNGYEDNLSLDRIDVNGNYEPDNCRWITMAEQQSNRRNNVFVEYKGEKHTLTEWSRITGISRSGLSYRLSIGRPLDEVFKKGKIRVMYNGGHVVNGVRMSTAEICEKYGINRNTFSTRRSRGWSVDEIIANKRIR